MNRRLQWVVGERDTEEMVLSAGELLAITDAEAARVRAGHHSRLTPSEWPTDERWAVRIRSDDDVDVWLISWVPERSTELHDHAGSFGALTVVSGSLSEISWNGEQLQTRRMDRGDHAVFDNGWIHDVTRHAEAQDTASGFDVLPTLSVHAYSPPLTAMSYYEIRDAGGLRRLRTELTDVPEASPTVKGIEQLLAASRGKIDRVRPGDVARELANGGHLVDIRPAAQRAIEGEVPGALIIERNVLEWRLDPSSASRIPEATDWNTRWIVICSEGYTSSLAASALRDIGLERATDVEGGAKALSSSTVPL